MWRLVVPSSMERFAKDFSLNLDKQSGEDSGFYVRAPSMWTKYVHSQEDKLRESGKRIKFTLAECTGLQAQVIDWEKRETERYIFGYHCMLDSKGKKLNPVDCVFFPALSTKRDAMPLLKPIRFSCEIHAIANYNIIHSFVPGGREVFADVIRVSTPNNFYACNLSIAAGFGLFHGLLLRRQTSGQLPVVSFYS